MHLFSSWLDKILAKIETIKYVCDECGKDIGQPYGPLIVSFGVDANLFEGCPEDLPSTKYFCGWICCADWMAE